MTEKELQQARHRLEAAEARNRVKERKARTRRLIQEGAILEKVYPQAVNMDLERLEAALAQDRGALGGVSHPEGRTYSPPYRRRR